VRAAAEAVTSAYAVAVLRAVDDITWRRLNTAIREIEADPSWVSPRMLAPRDSPYSGCIVDPSVPDWMIFYRIVDKGAAVEIITIVDTGALGATLDPP